MLLIGRVKEAGQQEGLLPPEDHHPLHTKEDASQGHPLFYYIYNSGRSGVRSLWPSVTPPCLSVKQKKNLHRVPLRIHREHRGRDATEGRQDKM